ncbi:hypothetical protein [Changchengzhania lutea]|uniref:hypothetical protein n=1 Tax=Changchengzhania lutea TaxID=2049305 RepID=UPI00115ED55E|nr:hypothetical protein [Changchengzhania lutea]
MKNYLKNNFNKVFFSTLLLILSAHFIGFYTETQILIQLSKLMLIPLMLLVLSVHLKSIAFPLLVFLIFSFMGDMSSVFQSNPDSLRSESVIYFLSYIYLASVVIPKFKIFEIDKLIGIYLLLVFIINVYFLFILYGVLKAVIPDSTELLVFGLKSLSIIVLIFVSFGVYLNTQSESALLFLLAVMCFAFSTVLEYVSVYYLYHWSFEMFNNMIYTLGIYFIFKYSLEIHKTKVTVHKEHAFTSDNILA